MATEAASISFLVASVVEDVLLQQHVVRRDVELGQQLKNRRKEKNCYLKKPHMGFFKGRKADIVTSRDHRIWVSSSSRDAGQVGRR